MVLHPIKDTKESKESVKKEASCCCGNIDAESVERSEAAKKAPGIKVLGPGCARCQALERAVREALVDLGMDTTVDHVTDFAQIASYGVMTTPALVIDGKVVSYGKVLSKDEVKALLQRIRG